jgi:hypothetical protein
MKVIPSYDAYFKITMVREGKITVIYLTEDSIYSYSLDGL